MKKQIGLVIEYKKKAEEFLCQLQKVFGNTLSVTVYGIEDCTGKKFAEETVILTLAYSSSNFFEIKKLNFSDKTLIPTNLMLVKRNLLLLNTYPKGTKALLVNVSKLMVEETITQLYQAGYSNIEFIPYYPGCSITEKIPLAVTPGESALVPDFVTETIDIGARQIDIMTIVELTEKLHCEYILETSRFYTFFENQFKTSTGFSILMHQNQTYSKYFSTLIQMFPQGMIAIDQNNEIFDCNYTAASVLKKSRANLLHANAASVFPLSLLEKCRLQQVTIKTKLSIEKEKQIDIYLTPITKGTQYIGSYAILLPKGREKELSVIDSSNRKGHIAKYSFSDICGSSKEIQKTIELAKKMARTDSSILITGESGTGKELFAHAIHQNSARQKGPFVAINCSALPENLLESELFGYEEGAFTGAKKGGKIGFFELANTGTIFLDEIESMLPSTQLKLLRVIQEREIMRIGGEKIIPIDVRIISATNEELLPLTQSGAFRQDLFYRLSTLPLDIPPLRNRKEDILPLIEEFKKDLNIVFTLTQEVKNILTHYDWPGNIRELRNCVEYLGCHNVPVIEVENLSHYIRKAIDKKNKKPTYDIEEQILSILLKHSGGRKRIKEELLSLYGTTITEGALRGHLRQLKEKGDITSDTGRGGSQITPLGKKRILENTNK